ncbi:MAG: hypothetical protein QOF78_11 [Phycisphaerales bacterium]|jgi:hypothetical protein|nr:hypothetical protein [Phycisphaerales bacterium]
MRWRRLSDGGGVAFLLVCLAATSWCSAGIVVTARESSLAASGQTSADQFELSDTSTEFGFYDQTIGQSLPGAGGGTTSASASQRSNVTSTALPTEARGTAAAQVAELDAIAAQASTSLDISFDVIGQPETLTIQGHVQGTFDGAARVTLENGSGTVFERRIEIGDEGQIDFSESLTLEPGSYTIFAETHVTGTQSPNSAEFEFAISQGPPALIPLPPPLLGGAAMLLLAAWPLRRLVGRR